MTIVKATCPDCRDIEVDARRVTAVDCDQADSQTGCYARLTCPLCARVVLFPIEPRLLVVLVANGAGHQIVTQPREVPPEPGAPDLTYDDLIDFHAAIDDELEALLRSS